MNGERDAGTWIDGVLPDEPRVVRFLNTIWADRDGPHDDLATPTHATVWLERLGYSGPGLTSRCASDLRDLRNALRRLAAHRTEDPRARAESPLAIDDAIQLVNAIAAVPAPGPQIVVSGPATLAKVPPGTLRFADVMQLLAREGVDAVTPPDALSLRACLAPSCVLYYVQDHPRRAWCSASCGNRARAARHYARIRG